MKTYIILFLTGLLVFVIPSTLSAAENKNSEKDNDVAVDLRRVYYKIDQGFSTGRLSDRKMSNLHYTGPGGFINFGRRVNTPNYISEWNFLRVNFNYMKPEHGGTDVYKPSIGLRYIHLRKLNDLGAFRVHAGVQTNLFADIRIAPRLGNSYLFADIVAEVRPQGKLSTGFHLLRQWNMDFSLSATLLGLGVRFPEYGTSFRVSQDGGAAFSRSEAQILKPSNFGHFTTGIFFSESFGDASNPNRFRIGYIWDYYTMKSRYDLNVNNAIHQIVLEFYFKVN